jgi:peroxiredoxin
MGRVKQTLISLLSGIFVVAAVFAFVIFCSSDMRATYACGSVLLLLAGMLIGKRPTTTWLDMIVLCLPLEAVFGMTAVPQLHPVWPDLILWPAAAALGFYLGRPRSTRFVSICGFGALVAISTWYCVRYLPVRIADSLSHYQDSIAPSFKLIPLSGTDVPISPVSGKILVVDFFATWCAPCIAELPELSAARAELRNRPDVRFVVVGGDAGRDTPEKLRAFAEKRHLDLPLAFDQGGTAQNAFGYSGFPTLIVIDRAGHIRLVHQGYNASETGFRNNLIQLLRTL